MGVPLMEAVRLAFESLRASKLRSALTLLGVILSTATLIAVMSIIHGMDVYVATSASTMGNDGFRVARAVFGAALYLTVVGLFGLGLGAILRNTAGGIASFAAIMFVLPPLMNVLPNSWNHAASPYLPLAAGEAILSITPGNNLSPWAGFALFCGYAAAALAVAAVLLVRRDT